MTNKSCLCLYFIFIFYFSFFYLCLVYDYIIIIIIIIINWRLMPVGAVDNRYTTTLVAAESALRTSVTNELCLFI